METWSSCYSHLAARKQNAPQASFVLGMMLCIALLSKPRMTWSSQSSTVGKWKENTKALFFLDMGKKTEKSVFFVSILLLGDPSKTIATENSSRIAKETIQEEICTTLRLHSNYISHLHVRAEDPSYSAWLFPPDLFISYNFSFQRDPWVQFYNSTGTLWAKPSSEAQARASKVRESNRLKQICGASSPHSHSNRETSAQGRAWCDGNVFGQREAQCICCRSVN